MKTINKEINKTIRLIMASDIDSLALVLEDHLKNLLAYKLECIKEDGFISSVADEAPHTVESTPYNDYFRDVKHLGKIDIYRFLELFGVADHALGHAIKKLALAGVRTGGKPSFKDIAEARDTLNRKLEMIQEDDGWNDETIKATAFDKLALNNRLRHK